MVNDVSMSLDLIAEVTYPTSPRGTGYIWVRLMGDRSIGFHLPTFEQVQAHDNDQQCVYLYRGKYFSSQDGLEFYVKEQMPRLIIDAMLKR